MRYETYTSLALSSTNSEDLGLDLAGWPRGRLCTILSAYYDGHDNHTYGVLVEDFATSAYDFFMVEGAIVKRWSWTRLVDGR